MTEQDKCGATIEMKNVRAALKGAQPSPNNKEPETVIEPDEEIKTEEKSEADLHAELETFREALEDFNRQSDDQLASTLEMAHRIIKQIQEKMLAIQDELKHREEGRRLSKLEQEREGLEVERYRISAQRTELDRRWQEICDRVQIIEKEMAELQK